MSAFSTQLGSPLCIAGFYSPPQDHGEHDDHQTEAAHSDGGNDREVVVVNEAFALRRFDVFTIRLQVDLKSRISFCNVTTLSHLSELTGLGGIDSPICSFGGLKMLNDAA